MGRMKQVCRSQHYKCIISFGKAVITSTEKRHISRLFWRSILPVSIPQALELIRQYAQERRTHFRPIYQRFAEAPNEQINVI